MKWNQTMLHKCIKLYLKLVLRNEAILILSTTDDVDISMLRNACQKNESNSFSTAATTLFGGFSVSAVFSDHLHDKELFFIKSLLWCAAHSRGKGLIANKS